MPSIHPLTSRAHRVEAKYNVVTEYPNLRLHSAAAKGDIGSVQYALTHGQPANSVLDGILPLHAACSGGSELVVKLLLDFGADVNAPRLPRRYSDKKSEGGTIIGSSGSTPLHFAAANGHATIVRILLQSGADPARADKHGTGPEALAVNFGHDEVATILREWEAAHPPLDPTRGGSTGAPVADGPPSPSRSRRLQVKRSLENLLTRKGHGMTPAHSQPGIQTLSPVQLDATSPFSTVGGSMTPASTSSEAFGNLPASSRRPSLPQIFERGPNPLVSPNKKTHRPRSAGAEDDPPISNGASTGTLPTIHSSSQKRLGAKISLLNIFKKSHDLPSGIYAGSHGASSPNLLEFLQQPVEITKSRPRSSIEEVRMAPNPRLSLERDRTMTLSNPPPTAPVQRTAFFGQSPTSPHEDSDPVAPLPTGLPPRTMRSSSQTRPGFGPNHRTRTDSQTTVSSASSFDAYQASSTSPAGLQGVGRHNNWARSKRDRSASEGAGALGKRSPLMSEWGKDDGVVKRDLPGVIADDDEEGFMGGERTAVASPEQIGPLERVEHQPPPPSAVPRRPSLTNQGGDSTGSVGHNRTSSSQSKNLRFELPISESPVSATKLTSSPPVSSSPTQTPCTSSTATPSLSKRKSLRTSSSAGSLPKSISSTFDATSSRPYSAEGTKNFGSFLDFDEADEKSRYDTEEEECNAAAEAEGGDSVGEPVWQTGPFAKTGSLNSSTTRPSVSTASSPKSPNGTINSPVSSVASPASTTKQFGSLSVTTPSKVTPAATETDTRLRGASVSSSKSTDTSTSSANPPANGGSDSSGQPRRPPGWSTGTSTASVGTSAVSTLRASKLDPIIAPPAFRHAYDIDGYDSSASERYSKTSPPLPVLIRSVNSHAQAHALVEKAQKEILNLTDLSPDYTGGNLSAQLAAFGETLALERRFAKGEAQKNMWISRKGLEDDTDDEDGDVAWDEEKTKYPRGVAEAFVPQMKKKPSNGAIGGGGNSTSPVIHKKGSLEFASSLSKARGSNRNRPARSRVPVKSQTSPASHTPMRTTPSNVGPPVGDIKTARISSDEAHHLGQLVLHGIEITKTLPTPTESPQSTVDIAALQATGRNIGVDETAESPTGNESGSSVPKTAPLNNSRAPEIMVTDFQPVPLSRVNTAPSPSEKPVALPSRGHGRTASSGSGTVIGGLDYIPPRSESRMARRFGGLKSLVQTLKGK